MMVLRIDPKMVETMLAVAKGEHAVALHNIKEEEPIESGPAPSTTIRATRDMAGVGQGRNVDREINV